MYFELAPKIMVLFGRREVRVWVGGGGEEIRGHKVDKGGGNSFPLKSFLKVKAMDSGLQNEFFM